MPAFLVPWVAAAIMAALGGGWAYIQHHRLAAARASLEVAEVARSNLLSQLAAAKGERQAVNAALVLSEAKASEAIREGRSLRSALRRAQRRSQRVSQWSDEALPAPIVELLRRADGVPVPAGASPEPAAESARDGELANVRGRDQ